MRSATQLSDSEGGSSHNEPNNNHDGGPTQQPHKHLWKNNTSIHKHLWTTTQHQPQKI